MPFLSFLRPRVAGLPAFRCWLVRCLTTLSFAFVAPAHGADYEIGPAPVWVVPADIPAGVTAPAEQISSGTSYLLADYQVLALPKQVAEYRRTAATALNERGVDALANIEIVFDPGFQKLKLHTLAVTRDGRRTDRLGSASIRVLQRESALEYAIIDGRKSAHIVLDDIRPGDTVEYAYSLTGTNPALGGAVSGSLPLQFNAPIGRIAVRLLHPQDMPLRIRTRNTTLTATESRAGTLRVHRWTQSPVPALLVEADAPGWYSPFASIEWSSFEDWQAVAAWGAPLYRPVGDLGPALQAEVTRIRAEHASPAQRAVEALRLVQGNVRYLGIEIGSGSLIPRRPAEVFERRFGDCKDKTLLLISLLDALGIDARAALVNTAVTRGVADHLPSPGVFNHVLVQAGIDGASYWLDPTMPKQTAPLSRLHQPDYGLALPLDTTRAALVPMRAEGAPPHRREINVTYDLTKGMDQPARFTVTTTNEGMLAEQARAQLASGSMEALQKNYLNYYATRYPGVRTTAPIRIDDDAATNRITISESYEIPGFWPRNDAMNRREAGIRVPEIEDILRPPDSAIRHAPLPLPPPFELSMTTQVRLHEALRIDPDHLGVTDEHFRFRRDISTDGLVLTLKDRYSSLRDHVMPADLARYTASLDQARNASGYMLYRNDVPADAPWHASMNWSVAMLALLLCGALFWLGIRLYRYDPPPPDFEPVPRLTGLGGWLLLPCLALLLTPFRLAATLINEAPTFAPAVWNTLTAPGGAAYHPLWAPTLLLEVCGALVLMMMCVVALALHFRRRSSLPRVFLALLTANIVYLVALIVMLGHLPIQEPALLAENRRALMQGIGHLVVWTLYFQRSKRARSTFRHRYRSAPVRLPGAVESNAPSAG